MTHQHPLPKLVRSAQASCVACPECGAAACDPCTPLEGIPATTGRVHVERHEAAQTYASDLLSQIQGLPLVYVYGEPPLA